MSTCIKENSMSSAESNDTLKAEMWGRGGKYGDEQSLGIRTQGTCFPFAPG